MSRAEERAFLDDAPWDKCEHGNYVRGCGGCWDALIGQAKKADQWRPALEDAGCLIRDLRTEIATLTRKERDERQRFLLEQADDMVGRLFR